MSLFEEKRKRDELKRWGLFALTWPIFIELFLHMLMGSVDTFMLSHVSDDAVAAVGVSNQVLQFTMILFGFTATGTAVVVAQYLGANRNADSSKVAATAIVMNLFVGVAMSIVLVVFREPFLRAMNLPEKLMSEASIYMAIVGGTIFVQALLLTVSSVIRANGFTRDAMFVTLGMNVLNAIGNYLFIYGVLGFPEWGVQGVALSTAFSRGIGIVVLFVMLYRRLEVSIEWKDYIHLKMGHVKKILKIGIPSAGEHLAYSISQLVITYFITILGVVALATRIYTIQIMLFVLLFGLAVGQGTQILVGRLVGAGEKEKAYNQLLKSLRVSFLITLTVVIGMAVFRKPLLGIFTSDPEIIKVGSMLLLFCIVLEPGRTFNLVVINSLRAAGDVRFPVYMGMLSMWGISVPLSYFLGIYLEMGLLGVWIALATDEWFRGIIMYFRWRSRVWERMSLVDSGEEKGTDEVLTPLDQTVKGDSSKKEAAVVSP